MVELKVPGSAPTGIEQRAVELIRRYDAHADVVLSSFNPLVLRRLKKLDPQVRTALIFMDTNWNPELLAEIRPEDRVDLPWFLRQEWIRRAIRKMVKPDLLSINHEVDERRAGPADREGMAGVHLDAGQGGGPAASVRQAAVRSDLGPANPGEGNAGPPSAVAS